MKLIPHPPITPGRKLKRHRLSVAFGDMSPPEFAAFLADIAKNGIRNAVTLFEGYILDGWHRYRAAQQLGILCPAKEFRGSLSEASAEVDSQNNYRRHDDLGTRVALLLQREKYAKLGTKKEETEHTREVMQRTGASSTVVNQVKRVAHRDPALLSAVGKTSLKALDPGTKKRKACAYPGCLAHTNSGATLCPRHRFRLSRGTVDHTPFWPAQIRRLVSQITGSTSVTVGVEGDNLVAVVDGERHAAPLYQQGSFPSAPL